MERKTEENKKNVENIKFYKSIATIVATGITIVGLVLVGKSCSNKQQDINTETTLDKESDDKDPNIKETDTFETEPYEYETESTTNIYITDPYETNTDETNTSIYETETTIPYETDYDPSINETTYGHNEKPTSNNSKPINPGIPSRPHFTEDETTEKSNEDLTVPYPTKEPSTTQPSSPTEKPTIPVNPTDPTQKPTIPVNPTDPTQKPTIPVNPTDPTEKPTERPTEKPTERPTEKPTERPTQDETKHECSWVVDSISYNRSSNDTHSKITKYKCSCGKTYTSIETENCTYGEWISTGVSGEKCECKYCTNTKEREHEYGEEKVLGCEYVGNKQHAMEVEEECINCGYKHIYKKKSENCDLSGQRITLSDGLTVVVECPDCSYRETVEVHDLGEFNYVKVDDDCCIAIRTCKNEGCTYHTETKVPHNFVYSGTQNALRGYKYVCSHCGAVEWSKEQLTSSYNEDSQIKSLSSVSNAINVQKFNQNFKTQNLNAKTYGMNDFVNNQKYKQKVLRYAQRKY